MLVTIEVYNLIAVFAIVAFVFFVVGFSAESRRSRIGSNYGQMGDVGGGSAESKSGCSVIIIALFIGIILMSMLLTGI